MIHNHSLFLKDLFGGHVKIKYSTENVSVIGSPSLANLSVLLLIICLRHTNTTKILTSGLDRRGDIILSSFRKGIAKKTNGYPSDIYEWKL